MIDLSSLLYYQFVSNSGLRPERILLYRDGVSDGEFGKIFDVEIATIRKGLVCITQALCQLKMERTLRQNELKGNGFIKRNRCFLNLKMTINMTFC